VLSLVQDDRPFARTEALIDLAIAHRCLAEYDRASGIAHHALALSRRMSYRMREGQALTVLAEVSLGQGQARCRPCTPGGGTRDPPHDRIPAR
jgi:hypothetical protein